MKAVTGNRGLYLDFTIYVERLDLTGSEPWEAFAACAQADPEAFYPDNGSVPRLPGLICRNRCPVRGECLDFALGHMANQYDLAWHGIWGGTSRTERLAILGREDEDENEEIGEAA